VCQNLIGRGAYSNVCLERCEQEGNEKLRAIKETKKFVVIGEDLDYAQELEAIVKFSHYKVARTCRSQVIDS
jgi:hypothetical protein